MAESQEKPMVKLGMNGVTIDRNGNVTENLNRGNGYVIKPENQINSNIRRRKVYNTQRKQFFRTVSKGQQQPSMNSWGLTYMNPFFEVNKPALPIEPVTLNYLKPKIVVRPGNSANVGAPVSKKRKLTIPSGVPSNSSVRPGNARAAAVRAARAKLATMKNSGGSRKTRKSKKSRKTRRII
jgi:hypothetical protein